MASKIQDPWRNKKACFEKHELGSLHHDRLYSGYLSRSEKIPLSPFITPKVLPYITSLRNLDYSSYRHSTVRPRPPTRRSQSLELPAPEFANLMLTGASWVQVPNSYVMMELYMGGCQNYGPFWVPTIIRHLIFRVPKKGP